MVYETGLTCSLVCHLNRQNKIAGIVVIYKDITNIKYHWSSLRHCFVSRALFRVQGNTFLGWKDERVKGKCGRIFQTNCELSV